MINLINPQIEIILRGVILPDLDRGRKDFDRPHTEAVVYWMKSLINQLNKQSLDNQVLITAAYAHDWGYTGLFDGSDSNKSHEISKRKPLHMEKGAKLITDLIRSELLNYFSESQIIETANLVRVHDKVEMLKTEEEILLMEADTLGMLDVSRVKPTFSKQDNENFIKREIYNRRLPLFIHSYAVEQCNFLAEQRQKFYD